MRIFITKKFARFIRKEKINVSTLCQVVDNLETGLIDAHLGGHVIKQRLARLNQGRSGGYRLIIIYDQGHRLFFVHGFAKADEDNITVTEHEDFKRLAPILFVLDEDKLAALLKAKEFVELECYELH